MKLLLLTLDVGTIIYLVIGVVLLIFNANRKKKTAEAQNAAKPASTAPDDFEPIESPMQQFENFLSNFEGPGYKSPTLFTETATIPAMDGQGTPVSDYSPEPAYKEYDPSDSIESNYEIIEQKASPIVRQQEPQFSYFNDENENTFVFEAREAIIYETIMTKKY
jgi:hypothetical protein